MFERYTEKARRAVFFARYEASQYGSPVIDTEHLLLGLLRENKHLRRWMPDAQPETIRQWIDAEASPRGKTSTSIDLPLTEASKKILKSAADEADRLSHRHIGTEHLFLALFTVEDCLAAKLLRKAGADAAMIRAKVTEYEPQAGLFELGIGPRRPIRMPTALTVEIHGSKRNADDVRDVVSMIRSHNLHWQKTLWKARDIVIHLKTRKISFDLTLAEDSENFALVKAGWQKDRCFVCGWQLFESGDEHGTGYTNGRNWLCLECCERFIDHDFFSSSQSEMT